MHDLTPDEWAVLQAAVRQAAHDVASNWLHTVTEDDIEQDVMVDLLESPATLSTIANADPKTQRNFLKRLAVRAAAKMQDDYEYFSGNYTYDVTEVRSLLESGVFEDDAIDFAAERLDLFEAIFNMVETQSVYVDVLTDRYSAGGTAPDNDSPERKRLNRAVRELTNRMNRIAADRQRQHHDGPGSRKAISNSSARVETGD